TSEGVAARGSRNYDLLAIKDKFPICIEAVSYCPIWKDFSEITRTDRKKIFEVTASSRLVYNGTMQHCRDP
ncbi:hypothetical protein SK128_004308, partial [Halocaridina rubra]